MNRYPVFLSTWFRPWTCLCFMNYMEGLLSPVKSWAGEWNRECLGITLLWHGMIIWPFSCQSCMHNSNSLSCWVSFPGVDCFDWSGEKVVDWFQWFELHAFFEPEVDIVAIVRNLNLVWLKPLACDISDLRLGYRCLRFSRVAEVDLGGGCRGCAPPPLPEMTCGFLIQLVFCKKKNYVVY